MSERRRGSTRVFVCGVALALLGGALQAGDAPPNPQNATPTQGAIDRGRRLYAENCSNCHGNRADGNPAAGIPSLAGQHSTYLLKQLVAFTDSQRDAPAMHARMATQALQSPRIWRELAQYLSSLPPNSEPQTGDGSALEQGKGVYQRFCIDCHGRYGEGKSVGAVPALRGQDYGYLAQQIRDFAALHRTSMEFPVIQTIGHLSAKEREAVADYVSRFPVDTQHP